MTGCNRHPAFQAGHRLSAADEGTKVNAERVRTDVPVVGGGTAGCAGALETHAGSRPIRLPAEPTSQSV